MDFLQKLTEIQARMKAPKNLYNTFGKYKYRNLEGILEALKPFEQEYKVTLLISDDIVDRGGHFYVRAEATLFDCESDGQVTVSAWAREPESKKGMDEPQVTGTASSYARKYALNGLFLLDDTKDPDADEYHRQTAEKEEKPKEDMDAARMQAKRNVITDACAKRSIQPNSLLKSGLTLEGLTEAQLDELTAALKGRGWFK